MYAEERQQAIADLVAATRPAVGERPGRRSTPSPPRRCAATCPCSSGPGLLRRVHGGAVPAGALTRARGQGRRARPRARRREGPDRQGGPRPAPADRRQRAAGRRHHHRPAGDDAPPRPAADRGHQRGADRGPAGRLRPASSLHLLPGRVRADHPGRRRRGHRRGARPAARRRRVRRHQRAVPRPRPEHPGPRRGRRQARDGRRRAPGRGAGRLLQDRPASTPSGFAELSARSTCWSPTAASPPPTARRSSRAGRRGRGRMIAHRSTAQPEHRPHRRPLTGRSSGRAARCLRAESVTSQAGGKGVNISRAAVAADVPDHRRAARPHEDDPFVVELLARRHRLPARAARRRRSGST